MKLQSALGIVRSELRQSHTHTHTHTHTVSSRKFSVLQAVWFIRKRYHREGLWSLWRGNSATLARVVPYAALQFMFFEQYKTLLKPAGRK